MIKTNQEYQSEILASTELHAGLFFAILYCRCIRFINSSEVEIYNKVIDKFRPMDDYDVEIIEKDKLKGTYSYDSHGHIECVFSNGMLNYTGMIYEKDDNNLVIFNVYGKMGNETTSMVFRLVK